MPWFVFRLGPGDQPRIFIHRDVYVSREAAEAASYDEDRFVNVMRGPIDESIPPIIVEADDHSAAMRAWQHWMFKPEWRAALED